MPDQSSLNLSTKTGPVECFGKTFPTEEVRREHYLKLLAAKLKEPAFRQLEGFPLGTDEAILALSDPPYYTACPNPWLGDFVKHYGTPYDPKKPYHREPFAADVSEGKTHPIYLAHSYHTKVPHRAIMRYILHYTEPGQLVFDGFCGTGMTGVAAQLCGDRKEVQELGYRVLDDGTILNEEGKAFSRIGARRAVLNDLSPAASFIASNYVLPFDHAVFEKEAARILATIEKEIGWLYETNHKGHGKKGRINFTVWSDVFTCPECGGDIVFWEDAVEDGDARGEIQCPNCKAELQKRHLDRTVVSQLNPDTGKIEKKPKRQPVLINHTFSGNRHEKTPDKDDLALIEKIKATKNSYWFPTTPMEHDSDLWMERDYTSLGVFSADGFYSRRSLLMCAFAREAIMESPPAMRRSLWFWFQSVLMGFSLVNRYRAKGFSQVNQILSGTLYIGANTAEISPWYALAGKISRFRVMDFKKPSRPVVSTMSSTQLDVPPESLDYIFIDPPFGSNIIYSDLSFLWEAWLGLTTHLDSEAVVHRRKKEGRSLEGYSEAMRECFALAYRALKPGRWMTIEFSNTRSSVWNSIQTALQEAGFVVANVAALDKQMGSFKAVTTTTAVKQDLVISAYKPNGGLESRFAKHGQTIEGVWDFVRTHLRNLPITKAKGGQLEPIAERDPRILYDRMVAFYIGHSTSVPLSSGEFQAELHEHFPVRDGMVFLPEQVNIYDQKRVQMESIGQLAIFVEDERTAIDWLRQYLKDRPSTRGDITPEFNQQLNVSWKKWEARPELHVLLDQNFLRYDGVGAVPSQIHSYLSTQFKELRNLDKDHAQLRHRAKERWYVPDPKKNIDVETLRNKRLLEEFWLYLPEGYVSAARNPEKAPTLPGMAAATPRPKVPRSKKLREVRTEAIRVGFKHCYQLKDYYTILAVADMLPESVLNEDEQLQMLYDNAALRSGASTS